MNSRLAGADLRALESPASVATVFDSRPGRNLGGATGCRALAVDGVPLGDAALRPLPGGWVEVGPVPGAIRYEFGR
jgi:hypothetical protein